MKNLNRLVFLLSLSFIGLTTLDQSSHVLEDHGKSENIEHVACVLENPEPQTLEVAVNNFISFDIEAGLSVFYTLLKFIVLTQEHLQENLNPNILD